MTTRKETVRVCDVCERRVSDEGEIQYGGSAHQGWFSVHRTSGKTDLGSLKAHRDWDVCGIGCLKQLTMRLGRLI